MQSAEKYWIFVFALAVISGLGACGAAEHHWSSGGEKVLIEKGLKKVSVGDMEYSIVNVENIDKENFYKLDLSPQMKITPVERTDITGIQDNMSISQTLRITSKFYERALSETVELKRSEEGRSFMLLLLEGGVIFAVFSIAWLREPESRGKAATLLLENKRGDARVRDVEILAVIMELEEFTIPQLMKRVGASRSTAYRTVKEFIALELVEKTDREETPGSSGGKPGRIYRYIGPEEM